MSTESTTAKKTAPAAKKTAAASNASNADVESAQKPGNAPADFIPNPDTVTGLTSAHAGPMQGGDPSERDAYVAASGPLTSPTDRQMQTYPEKGYGLSSTDATFGAAGGRTVAGERFDALVGEDGESVGKGDLFTDVEGKGYVVASQRVFEQFYYPNTIERAKRLLFVAGQKVPRAEAERIKATLP